MKDSCRFKCIDIHTHILPRELSSSARKYLELRPNPKDASCLDMFKEGKFFRTVQPNCFDVETRLKEMDATGVTMQVLSTVPVLFNYASDNANEVLNLAQELNDHIASICRRYPTRFIGLGSVPLQAPELAIQELRRCVLELNLKGVQIGTHCNDWTLDDENLHPFWHEVEKLDACVFVHPWDMPTGKAYEQYWTPWLCGMPFETTAAICSILMGGILEQYPKLRILFAHGGGSFPFTMGRIDHGHECRPDICASKNSNRPSSYIGRFFVDSLVHDGRALKFLVDTMGEDCITLGSDYPFPLGETKPGTLIHETFHNNEELRKKLLFQNACQFFKILK